MAITRTYAVGGAGKVIRLDNHTGPWVDITPSFPNMGETTWFDVMSDPLDPDKVTIVGDDNLIGSIGSGILVSTDAGVTWSIPGGTWPSQAGKVTEWREVWYVDSNVIWAVGFSGNVVRSTDAGLTFITTSRVDLGFDLTTAAIHAINQNTAIVAGGTGGSTVTYVWKTSNGGVTWTRLNGGASLTTTTPSDPSNPVGQADGIWMSSDEQEIIVSTNSTQNRSTNGGTSFSSTLVEMFQSGIHLTWYPSHDPNPATMRHVGGTLSHINESLNNGSSWSLTRIGEGFTMIGAHFYSVNDGYYIIGNTIYSTSDGGVTGVQSHVNLAGELNAIWTQEAIGPIPGPGCPCYLATDCENPDNQVAIQIDCTLPGYTPLVPGTVYQFSEPDYMAGICWTVEETVCPEQQTIDLASGNVSEGVPGVYDDQDYQWQVVSIPNGAGGINQSPAPPNPGSNWAAGTTATVDTPFPARIGNQLWYNNPPPYGVLPGGQWITFGQPDGSATCPGGIPGCPVTPGGGPPNQHSFQSPVTIYELQFTPPINFVPELHLKFLIDNSAAFELNGVFLTPSNAPLQPWSVPYEVDVDAINNTGATFNAGVNFLRVHVWSGSSTNGIAIEGTISNLSPPSVAAVVDTEWTDCNICLNPIVPNICWDLEVVCNGPCPDVFAINSFDFTPFIGQNISIQPPLSTNPECWYTPYALRQSTFAASLETSGGGYNLSFPFSPFQLGADNITFSIPSLIFNGVEQIVGSPPTNLMTPANIQFVNCQQMACSNVPINNIGGLTGFSNVIDFINNTLGGLGITTIQAFNNSFDNCPIVVIKPLETIRIQYRDGDTFSILLNISNSGQGLRTVLYEVQAGNISINTVNSTVSVPTCNDNIYCLTDPAAGPSIISVTVEGPCPMPPVGEACAITPRLGEPGFSTKNCDPKKVIDIKSKYADSIYALFKRMRYGIETCCEFDLDKIDIKNQLIDLGMIYDPDLCIDQTPVTDCCLQPCNAIAELFINLAVACPAPIDPIVNLITNAIPKPCIAPTPIDGKSVFVRGSVSVPGTNCRLIRFLGIDIVDNTVTGTECDSTPINLTLVPGAPAVVLCVNADLPYNVGSGLQITVLGICT